MRNDSPEERHIRASGRKACHPHGAFRGSLLRSFPLEHAFPLPPTLTYTCVKVYEEEQKVALTN